MHRVRRREVDGTMTGKTDRGREVRGHRGAGPRPDLVSLAEIRIAADCPRADLVVVPVSGGGLISGIAAAVRAACSGAAVVGVEPELAADARDSFRRGEPVAWPAAAVQRTIADALRVERVGTLPFAHIRELVTDIITVTEDEMLAAVGRLARQARLVAEPGGAAAVAACLFRSGELPQARTPVAVLSGGNIDPELLAGIVMSN
jgi:threonine dehydratase